MSIIKDLIDEGVVKGYWDFRSGTLKDFSGNSNDGVGTGLTWTNKGVTFCSSTSKVTVADHASLQLNGEGALIVYSDNHYVQNTYDRFISKFDAGGINYEWNVYSATQIVFYDGATQSLYTTNISNVHSLGINFRNTEKPECFVDGRYQGFYTAVVTVTTDDANLLIGNYYNNNSNLESVLSAAMVFSRKLTKAEHSQVYSELANKKWNTRCVNYSIPQCNVLPGDTNLIGGWDMTPKSNQILDNSENKNDMTVYGATEERTILGQGLHFDGEDNYCQISDSSSLDSATTAITLAFWIRPDDLDHTGAGTGARLLTRGSIHTITIGTDGTLTIVTDGISDTSINTSAGAITDKNWFFIVYTYSSSTGEKIIYINGEEDTKETSVSGSITTGSDAIYIGTDNGSGKFFLGVIKNIWFYSEAKDLEWVKWQYGRGKLAGGSIGSFGAYESTTSTTSGRIEHTPIYVSSGTFTTTIETVNNDNTKVIECESAGIIYIPTEYFGQSYTEAAFGEWIFWVYKADASTLDLGFATGSVGISSGYGVTLGSDESAKIVEYGVGDITSTGSISATTWTEIRVTRDREGLFTLYINGSAVDTGTDLTTTTASYISIDMDAGDKISFGDKNSNSTITKKLLT